MTKGETTRLMILHKAFDLVYQQGYQGTSVDKIIETTQVTKGAFYYHFKTKEEMGVAMINEVIAPRLERNLITPLANHEDAVTAIYETIKRLIDGTSEIRLAHGCPTNNLIQEMTGINENFRKALQKIMLRWEDEMVKKFCYSLENQEDKPEIYWRSAARFIISGYEGIRGIGKLHRSYAYYESYLQQLKNYLQNL